MNSDNLNSIQVVSNKMFQPIMICAWLEKFQNKINKVASIKSWYTCENTFG